MINELLLFAPLQLFIDIFNYMQLSRIRSILCLGIADSLTHAALFLWLFSSIACEVECTFFANWIIIIPSSDFGT